MKHHLRIGNTVQYKGHESTIIELREDVAVVQAYDLTFWREQAPYSDLQGVPITSERMEKFGFSRAENSTVLKMTIAYTDSEMPCTLQQSGSGILICRAGIYTTCVKCDYVHEIENLIFTLTGHELKAKEK